jgi:hypothetical protein
MQQKQAINDDLIATAKSKDLKSYLQARGFTFNRSDFCRSPFKRDTNWSFKYYPQTNTFFDWSKGWGGDTIKLVMLMENCSFADAVTHLTSSGLEPYQPNYKQIPKEVNGPFDVSKFINDNSKECELIREYAASRHIRRGFECGIFYTKNDKDEWVRNPSVMFVLRDKNLQPCGVKFRKVVQPQPGEERFSSRGVQGFYILENILSDTYDEPILFLIESESSANSLWEYCIEVKKSAVIVSFGSVGSQFEQLPIPYQNLKDKRLIIDYDGSEELYQQRLDNFKHLKEVKPLKIILPKGEDVNSLYSLKQMYKITNLLFNG